jgi:hypothetical protein
LGLLCKSSERRVLRLEVVRLTDFQVDVRSSQRGYIAGILHFDDDAQLHFREFVDVTQLDPRSMYAYHYQDQNARMIFRYDNALHRPALAQRDHKHAGDDHVEVTPAPSFADVLDE